MLEPTDELSQQENRKRNKTMKNKNRSIATALMALFPMTCMAQGEDNGPASFTYGTYLYCDVATQAQLDDVIDEYDKPVLDKAVADGRMSGWGYYSHMTGGEWRRLQYHTAPTLEAALHNQETIFAEIYADNEEAGQARSNACSGHDDYIWADLNSGGGDADESPASSLSVYYVCDVTRETETDEMVAETYAPILNQMVEDGKLMSWGWMAHRVGGKYRRLQTFFGASHAANLAARAELLQQTGGQNTEFGKICGSHTDYLWNIVH